MLSVTYRTPSWIRYYLKLTLTDSLTDSLTCTHTYIQRSHTHRQFKAFQRPSYKDGNVRSDDVIPLSQPVAIHNFTIRHSIFRLLHHWMCMQCTPYVTLREYRVYEMRRNIQFCNSHYTKSKQMHTKTQTHWTERHWWRALKRES